MTIVVIIHYVRIHTLENGDVHRQQSRHGTDPGAVVERAECRLQSSRGSCGETRAISEDVKKKSILQSAGLTYTYTHTHIGRYIPYQSSKSVHRSLHIQGWEAEMERPQASWLQLCWRASQSAK